MRQWLGALFCVVFLAAGTGAAFATPAGDDGPETEEEEGGGGDGALTFDETAELAYEDVDDYWRQTFPDVFGAPYVTIEDFTAYDADSDFSDDSCSQGGGYEEEYASNAFYCVLDDRIWYDTEPGNLIVTLFENYGAMSLVVILAHEWGHAITARLLTLDDFANAPSIVKEQQADCFAGAYIGWLADEESENLVLEPGDLELGLGALLEVRDTVGDLSGGHGNGFDRANAFSEGYEQGAARCADYITGGLPVITEIPFTSEEDFESEGNLSIADAIDLGTEDLDLYWATVFEISGLTYDGIEEGVEEFDPRRKSTLPKCEALDLSPRRPRDYEGAVFYCPGEEFIAYDEGLIEAAHEEIGDFAAMILIANAWAAGMQEDLELEGGADQVDCFAGSYAGSIPIEVDGDGFADAAANGGVLVRDPDAGLAAILLSPGDLDEVVQSFLLFSEPAEELESEASAYSRLQFFRDGFLNGESYCAELTS